MRSHPPALAHQPSSAPCSGPPRPRAVWRRLCILSVALNLLGMFGLGYVVYTNTSYVTNWYSSKIRGTSRESGSRPWEHEAYRQKTWIFSASNDMLTNKPLVVFVGDSLTNGFPWNEWLFEETRALIVKRAIDGATLDRLVDSFESIVPPNPHIQKMFIMIGINDILAGEFQLKTFTDRYRMLLEKLLSITAPDSICILSILPTRKESLFNATIRNVNHSLQSLSESQGVCYLDLYSQFTDFTGQLDQNLTYDGLHLTVEGYQSWLAGIRPHIPH
jgi:lysophospholipase L1-like esterase